MKKKTTPPKWEPKLPKKTTKKNHVKKTKNGCSAGIPKNHIDVVFHEKKNSQIQVHAIPKSTLLKFANPMPWMRHVRPFFFLHMGMGQVGWRHWPWS